MAKKGIIGNLQVRLSVNTAQFKKGFASARKDAGFLGKSIAGLNKSFPRLGKAIGLLSGPLGLLKRGIGSLVSSIGTLIKSLAIGVVGAATAASVAIGLLTRKGLQDIDKITKEARKLGFETESLSALGFAGELAGIDPKVLGKGLQKMIKNVAEAATGIGEAVREIERLGLSAKKLNQLKPEKQLEAILSALEKIPLQSDKVLIGEKLFGGRGLALITLTSEGIRQATEDAKNFGLTFSEIDGRKVENANDAVSRLKALFRGLGRILAVEVAPFIELTAKKFTDFATSGDGFVANIKAGFSSVLEGIANALDLLGLGMVRVLAEIRLISGKAKGTIGKGIRAGARAEIAAIRAEQFGARFKPRDPIKSARRDQQLAAARERLARGERLGQESIAASRNIPSQLETRLTERFSGEGSLGNRFRRFTEEAQKRAEENAKKAPLTSGIDLSEVGLPPEKLESSAVSSLLEQVLESIANKGTAKTFSDSADTLKDAAGGFSDAADTFSGAVNVGRGKQVKRGTTATGSSKITQKSGGAPLPFLPTPAPIPIAAATPLPVDLGDTQTDSRIVELLQRLVEIESAKQTAVLA